MPHLQLEINTETMQGLVKKAHVSGRNNLDKDKGKFNGLITFEERKDCIYYSWSLRDENDKFLAAKSMAVFYQTIPEGEEKFEFALNHALENISRTRLGRERVFEVESFEK